MKVSFGLLRRAGAKHLVKSMWGGGAGRGARGVRVWGGGGGFYHDTYGGKVEIHLRYQHKPALRRLRVKDGDDFGDDDDEDDDGGKEVKLKRPLLTCGLEFKFGLIATLCATCLHELPPAFWRQILATKYWRTRFWRAPKVFRAIFQI